MLTVWNIITVFLVNLFKCRQTLLLEILVLRQQLIVLQRKSPKRPSLTRSDRLIFTRLYRIRPEILASIRIVKPETVVRDNDSIFGQAFEKQLRVLDINDVRTAPKSLWQNACAERLIGSIRRECLDHVIVLSEWHLSRILRSYADYYNTNRTHLSLEKDCPHHRECSPGSGRITSIPQVGVRRKAAIDPLAIAMP